ncbi:glucose-6-phosphate dehydrogenase assembly protein OpcA [Prochlorococcus sp. MIT 1341]|uniref:glucose-6-phosphate dehydrogenase assembly protein OpcA n=1 Tax=Prochlorococcus sp. MIT 1341 TaxID=3096221 RepID=UPI002A7659D0|nr:glucose-6-phosphate dehydrogenase assembly protein OpcA [Prochlorococcus sp. MIT 1341]
MSPQLTLQTPLQLPPEEIPVYLENLWAYEKDQPGTTGANTFCLLVWQPAWLEQHLVRTGRINGPIIGSQRKGLVTAARELVLEGDLPHSTPPFDQRVTDVISKNDVEISYEDLRGQHIDSAISTLHPRRLITLAPTLDDEQKLDTLVAAYCPLPEDGRGPSACGDVIVFRGGLKSLKKRIEIIDPLTFTDLPCWLWWNGRLDEAPELLDSLALSPRRLVVDSALGKPDKCLLFLTDRVQKNQAIYDLNWLRFRSWRETLAIIFDPPFRHSVLQNVVQLDIDIEGRHPVQGLLLASWLADRLDWKLVDTVNTNGEGIAFEFQRRDLEKVQFRLSPLPVGKPSIHPGQIVGIRLICKSKHDPKDDLCVILGAESGECMRLEAGGMANMELLEEVVPNQNISVERDVARLLGTSRGSTGPLFASALPLAEKMFNLSKESF